MSLVKSQSDRKWSEYQHERCSLRNLNVWFLMVYFKNCNLGVQLLVLLIRLEIDCPNLCFWRLCLDLCLKQWGRKDFRLTWNWFQIPDWHWHKKLRLKRDMSRNENDETKGELFPLMSTNLSKKTMKQNSKFNLDVSGISWMDFVNENLTEELMLKSTHFRCRVNFLLL